MRSYNKDEHFKESILIYLTCIFETHAQEPPILEIPTNIATIIHSSFLRHQIYLILWFVQILRKLWSLAERLHHESPAGLDGWHRAELQSHDARKVSHVPGSQLCSTSLNAPHRIYKPGTWFPHHSFIAKKRTVSLVIWNTFGFHRSSIKKLPRFTLKAPKFLTIFKSQR